MKAKAFIKKYTMVIALVNVFILFAALTGGRLLNAQNLSNLLFQNAYVLVLACGMLLCILTGGNVGLSVGSTVCLVGAILLGVINQGMSIIGLDNNWQYVVKGAVLLAAVIFGVVSNHKTGKAG